MSNQKTQHQSGPIKAKVVRDGGASIWTAPGSSDRLKIVPKGTVVDIYEVQKWVRVSDAKPYHWINAVTLYMVPRVTIRSTGTTQSAPRRATVIREGGATIWTSPEAKARIKLLPKGTEVTVYEIIEWARVAKNQQHWMNMVTLQVAGVLLRIRRRFTR